MASVRFDLLQDRKGMVWDLLLYVPTVAALLSMAAKFWYGDNANLAYLLLFMGSFFFIAGANRILKTRLMILPSAPVAIEVDKPLVRLVLRGGGRVELAKDVKFYSDYAGRTYDLTGMAHPGRHLQFVFHKGQFPGEQDYKAVQEKLRSLAA